MKKANNLKSVDNSIFLLEECNETQRDQTEFIHGDDLNCLDQSFSKLSEIKIISDHDNQNNIQNLQFDQNQKPNDDNLNQNSNYMKQEIQSNSNQNIKENGYSIHNANSQNSSFEINLTTNNFDSQKDSLVVEKNITQNEQQNTIDIQNHTTNCNDILIKDDNQIIVQENDLNLVKQDQNQDVEKKSEEIPNQSTILNQVQAQKNNLEQSAENFQKNFENLIEIQKYFPNESKDTNYTQNIKSLQQFVSQLTYWPFQLQDAQNDFQQLLQKFLRLQGQIAFQIYQQFKINYKLEAQHLGKYLDENNKLIEKLNDLQEQFKKIYDEIKIHNILKYKNEINKSLKTVFASELDQDQSKQIQKLYKDYDQLQLQKMSELQLFKKDFNDFQLKIIEMRNDQEFLEKQIKECQYQAKLSQAEIDQANSEVNSKKDKNKNTITDYLEIINKQKQQLLSQLITIQQDEFEQNKFFYQKQQKEYEKITNQCSILSKSQFASQKNCFHYIFIIDQSTSFESVYNVAIQALANYAEKINANDSLSVIKFDCHASQVFYQKATPRIDKQQLLKTLLNPKFGGTSFTAAFTQLKDTLKNQVRHNEFPIILFITDGEDSSDLSSIIQDVLNQIEDLIFITLGYGKSINQKQLQLITNLFNKTSNQNRTVNQQEIKLFYQNDTPSKLENDILKISNMQMTIQEVEESRQYITKSIENQIEQLKDFSNKKRDLIKQQIQDLTNQENQLKQQTTNEELQKKLDEILKYLRVKKQGFIESEQKNETLKQQKEQQIYIENKHFYLKHFNKRNQCQKVQSEQVNNCTQVKREEYDFYKLFETKINDIITSFDTKLESLNQKIMQCYESETQVFQNIQTKIKEYGFENFNQFKLFQEYLKKIESIQMQANDIKESYILIIDSLVDIASNLEQCINFSLKSIENISISDTEGRILEYYKQLNDKITLKDKAQSRKKVLEIQNNTILQNCKKLKKMDLYEDCINTLEFSDIQELIESQQSEKEQKINEIILPKLIKKSEKVMRVESEKQDLEQQIFLIEEDIEKEQKKQNSSEKKQFSVKQLKLKLTSTKAKLNKKQQELNFISIQYQNQIYEDIKIAKQIIKSFIQAAYSAQIQLKYQFALKPFQYYLMNVQNLIGTLDSFRNPKLITNFSQQLISNSNLQLQDNTTSQLNQQKSEKQKKLTDQNDPQNSE
ncbi:hypothetical protein ABPG72_013668 [Tetrahymena utriculariae]